MLESSAMTRLEIGFSPASKEGQNARGATKIDLNVAMIFLGALLRESPHSLDGLSLMDQYVILAHSEPNNRATFGELGEIFGKSLGGIRNLYRRGIVRLWNDTPSVLQETYSLTSIFDATRVASLKTRKKMSRSRAGRPHTQEEKDKIGEGVIESFKNPEIKRKIVANAKRRRHTAEEKEKIGKANKGRERSVEMRLRMSRSQTKRYAKPEERKNTSEAKIRTSVRKDRKRVSNEDSRLWRHASDNNLIGAIIDKGFLTEAEISLLRGYFEKGHAPNNLVTLLNRFSIGVARLA